MQYRRAIVLTGHVRARNGSNSNRVRAAFLIAAKTELDLDVLRGAKINGLTAGASAPEILVADVIDASLALGSVALTVVPGIAENVEFKRPAGLNSSVRRDLTIDSRAA